MASPARYHVDPQRVVHETIDGEAIVIDLETGAYFSLTGSAPEIWRLLVSGWSESEIARGFVDGDLAAVEEEIARFTDRLCAAALIAADDRVAPQRVPPAAAPWMPPVLETYTDMEYFLLLDPVHDVQPAGWPHPKSELRP